VRLTATNLQVVVDINTARPDVSNYGLNATYTLIDIATGKAVVTSTTFSRVSYNIPGQEQRFASARGLRDAEDRAAKVIAENIRSRLASYFVAGS
jgi:LPS-assembly lipoprotein